MGGKATPGMPASGTVWLEVAPAAPAAALCVVAEPMLALAIIAVIARASLLRSASSLLVRLDILLRASRAIPYMPMASSYACWSPPSGGGFGLLSRDGPACTRPLCVTAGVAAALRWRFKEADGSFPAARSSRACCCFRSPQSVVPPAAPAVGEPALLPFGEPAILPGMPFFVGLVVDRVGGRSRLHGRSNLVRVQPSLGHWAELGVQTTETVGRTQTGGGGTYRVRYAATNRH